MTDTVKDHLRNYTLQYKGLEGCYEDIRYSATSYCMGDIASCGETKAQKSPLYHLNG